MIAAAAAAATTITTAAANKSSIAMTEKSQLLHSANSIRRNRRKTGLRRRCLYVYKQQRARSGTIEVTSNFNGCWIYGFVSRSYRCKILTRWTGIGEQEHITV
ncbi:hypothetical protein U1Q18_018217 [Sarracenia purpurea var. burkii]